MVDIESRIRRLEDRAELEDLVVRYFIAADDGDYETLATIFSADARFSAGSFDGGSSRSAVVESLRASGASMGPTVHTPNYTLLTFKGDDSATGLIGAHLELSLGGRTMFGAVRYVDEYVRAEGRWQIRSRHMRTIHIAPWEDVGTSLTEELNIRWPGADPQPSDFPKKKGMVQTKA
jgi:hypothetical protein